MPDAADTPLLVTLRYERRDLTRIALRTQFRRPGSWIFWSCCLLLLLAMNPWWPNPVSYASLRTDQWYRLMLIAIALLGPPMSVMAILAAARQAWQKTDPLHGDVVYAFYPTGISISGKGERGGRAWDVNERWSWDQFKSVEELSWGFLLTQKDGKFNLIPKRCLQPDQEDELRDWLHRNVPPEIRRF